ncbi:MAG TPA: TerB family tellurite resistance protein [Pseudolabrys sp.]|jgi:uncharacterized tellurite resistance protein B-like protein|nr:TerB family tellurite resistance protein [Pseudolabrys sp.]
MFESFRRLIAEVGEGGKHAGRFDESDYRLAATALLVHAAGVDGRTNTAERTILRDLLQSRFDLDEESAEELIAKATAAEQESVDLYRFTSRLGRALDEEGRARMIEMMWQMAYADGAVSEFEDNLIWRAADLLGVSPNERIALRNRVAAQRGFGGRPNGDVHGG